MTDRDLFLGARLEDGERALLDADHLTTHAVCLGMTGSGKTGLGIVALEELARRGVPLLVVDLKGDMVNLLLTFPDLAPASFAPWLPADEIAGRDRGEVAVEIAERWRRGLERAGLGGADAAAVRAGVRWQVVTPGVESASPLDILPSLAPPAAGVLESDPDGARERVDGVVSALLSLIGRGGDPLTDRDHVVLAAVVLEHWRRGEALDLAGLVRSLAEPPFDALGALPLELFYPRAQRMSLVMALNTLLASPAFAAWTRGTPLTMEALLGAPGAPRATILSVAHLDQRQRLFVLSLVVSELVAWMRRQPGASRLRALLYLDEVQGILPPHPANPPTKGPLLTLLKQGRAFGVGVWLATQNPVDLDYKAAGNAGVQLIGRLITERDRARALDGLGLVRDGSFDPDRLVAALGKREFLLVDVRATPRTRVFASRWALSYLRGPVTLAELGPLLVPSSAAGGVTAPVRPEDGATAGPASSPRPPILPTALPTRYREAAVGRLEPWLAVSCRVTLDRPKLGLRRTLDELWRVPLDRDGLADWEAAVALEAPPPLADEPAPGAGFPATAPARLAATLATAERDALAWRARLELEVLANPALGLTAEPEESREAFLERCLEAADRADDARQDAVRRRFESRMATLARRLERERDRLERDRSNLSARQAEEKLHMVEGLFSVLLGSRSARTAASKAASKVRSTATKRRMSQRAAGAVDESERDIERLETELSSLGEEMQAEVDRIAEESEALAARLEEVAIRPTRGDVAVRRVELVWG